MLLNSIILAISTSIDSLGIGITYGLKDTKITYLSMLILCIISILITTFSIFIGNSLQKFLSPFFANLLGAMILICMGGMILFQIFASPKQKKITDKPKVHQLFIRFLGITIQIIRNPISSDLDHSKQIDSKEAFYLAIALSMDSIGIGIGSSIMGINFFFFPLLVALFQILFLSIGKLFGSRIKKMSHLPEYIWNFVSGILLIFIGVSRFFMT